MIKKNSRNWRGAKVPGRMNRRGISPLIATVLLIAFAVALGSVVYTYFILLVDSGSGTSLNGCAKFVSLSTIKSSNGNYVYQYDAQTKEIKINLYNNGYSEVSGLTYSVIGTKDNYNVNNDMKDTISQATVYKLTIPYDPGKYGSIQSIMITPFYVKAGQQELCPDGKIQINEQTQAK